LFADILSEVAAGVTGGIGLAPSASVGDGRPGIFEPIHGSAPDIAGEGIANPTAMLRSVSMMIEYTFGDQETSARLNRSIDSALVRRPTRDLGGEASTVQFGDAVLAALTG
jgi:isocitrate/isopropylmalate dehydrogenase